ERGADVNAKESVRGFTAIMFAAAADRAPVVNVLAQRGANLKATTAVVDINSMGRGAFAGVLFGNPQAPPPANGQAGQGQAGRAGQAGQAQQAPQPGQQGQGQFGGGGQFGGRNGFQGTAGIDRQYQLNELVYAQG